eukprot:110646-Amphidinium_carterae.1
MLEEEYSDITGRLQLMALREEEEKCKDDISTTMVFSNALLGDDDICKFGDTHELFCKNHKHVIKKTMEQLDK